MRISEIFLSIQGEGVQMGLPTVFVRLYGCDLRCSWCDTMHAVEGGVFTTMSTEEVVRRVEGYGCDTVCITGGEPLLQMDEVCELASALLAGGCALVLETSGHIDPPAIFRGEGCMISMDCKCPGSGMEARTDMSLLGRLEGKDQLKFVLADEVDYDYARGVLKAHGTRARVVFQPTGGLDMRWLAERVLADGLGGVRVLPQLHKLIWGEEPGR